MVYYPLQHNCTIDSGRNPPESKLFNVNNCVNGWSSSAPIHTSVGPPIRQQWDDIILSLSHVYVTYFIVFGGITLHQTHRTTRLYTTHSTIHCIIKRKYVADSTGDPLYFYSIEFCYTQYPSIEQSMGDIISQNARSRTANKLSVC